MEEMFNQLLKQMKELTGQLQYQSAQLQQQTEQLTELQEIIAAKDAQIAALTARIEELTHKKNSGNSSKPPSSERLNKPAPKSLRTKSGKSAGGQPGHKGSGMKIDREPDQVIEHRPIQCEGCPYAGTCKLRCCETRYEYEAVVETKLIAHKVLGCKACALTGKAAQGIFPANITGAKQYGPGVAGLAVSLLTIGYMSVDRVQKLLKSLQIPVSSGAIQDMLTKAARLVKAPVERILCINGYSIPLRLAVPVSNQFLIHYACVREGHVAAPDHIFVPQVKIRRKEDHVVTISPCRSDHPGIDQFPLWSAGPAASRFLLIRSAMTIRCSSVYSRFAR